MAINDSTNLRPFGLSRVRSFAFCAVLSHSHNKSLDASGANVFRIMTGPAMLE
jgi:hypothetical protein